MPPDATPRKGVVDPLPPEDTLSQYGREDFRAAPIADQPGVSLTWGRHSPTAMLLAVQLFRPLRPSDRARHTTVARLLAAGFEVRHNPTQRNLFHVTVSYPGQWDAAVAERFSQCFEMSIGGVNVQPASP